MFCVEFERYPFKITKIFHQYIEGYVVYWDIKNLRPPRFTSSNTPLLSNDGLAPNYDISIVDALETWQLLNHQSYAGPFYKTSSQTMT